MAKLYFRYSAMNAGKTTALMQVAHNYGERGMKAIILKPAIDTKSNDKISSRIGLEKSVDFLTKEDDNLLEVIDTKGIDCILIDEAQFYTEKQIDELWEIAVTKDIPVICYGLRTDFQMKGFPGSRRLLLIAHAIEEIKTICRCGRKAAYNLRLLDGKAIFDGDQVAIDGIEATYESACGVCYLEKKNQK